VKFLIDNQLPPALARCIQSELHAEAIHISDVKLQTAGDRDVWNYASTGGWILISKDEDFASIFSRTPTARLLWVRLGNLPPRLSAREVQTCMAENHRPVRERGSFCRTSMSSHGSRRSAHSRLSDCFHPSYSAGGITIRKLRIWLWPRPHNSAQAISYCPGRST
jgi:predicted nuclease of predicted toxin-antitoxin system